MRRITLKSGLALGDIVALSAVPRELANQYPGQYQVAMDTPFLSLFESNPHVVPADDSFEVIQCEYHRDRWESVNNSNQAPTHLITAYCQDVANSLGITLRPSKLAGDIHLSRDEYGWKSIPHERFNCQRFWLVCSGGKDDFPIKQWSHDSYQRVIDWFRGRIQFVQVGSNAPGHMHRPLNGVLNLVGQTDIRQLVRLVHSSCGILCGITGLVHLAAAVPLPTWQKRPKPCVVIAGGREPRTWYGYPTHRILESVGTLPCCSTGGCWHSHVVPVLDGQDDQRRFCERVVNDQPKCMNMIRPESVILEIEKYMDSEGIE